MISQPPIAQAEGVFSYREYLSRHDVHFQLGTNSVLDWRMQDEDDPPPVPHSVRFQRWAREALANPLEEEDDSLRLLWAMTLGWRT